MEYQRPTSPHLSIYRWQITSVLSILHRMTGLALYAGSALLVCWLWCAAYKADYYKQLHAFMGSPAGLIMLIGWTAAFYYHLFNGVRHLWWDTGRGFGLKTVAGTGWMMVLLVIALTALTWWRVLEVVQ